MKTEKQIRIEIHDEMVRKIVLKRQELDEAHLREPLKKQDKLCAELQDLEDNLSLLEKRMREDTP